MTLMSGNVILMPHGIFSYAKFDLCKGRSYCKNALTLFGPEKTVEMITPDHEIISF